MGASAGPNLAGIGRGGDSNLVLEMDAHDAKSYPGEPTSNIVPNPNFVGGTTTTWNVDGTGASITAVADSDNPANSPYILKVVQGSSTTNVYTELINKTIQGSSYTLSCWAKGLGTMSIRKYDNNSGSTSSSVVTLTDEWQLITVYATPNGSDSTSVIRFYICDDLTGDYAYLAGPQFEKKAYATPYVWDGYNGRPATTDLMIHGNVGSGQSFSDSSPQKLTLTANGNVTHSATQSKFSGGSIYFDGTGDYLSVPDSTGWNFSTGDFTIDFWVRFDGDPSTGMEVFFSRREAHSSTTISWQIYLASNLLYFNYGSTNITKSWNPAGDTWYHVALCRYASSGQGTSYSTLNFFVDGTSIGTSDVLNEVIGTVNEPIWIGANRYGPAANPFNGWMDEIRITKGTALWRGTFTPPTRRNLSAPVVDRSGNDNGGNFATKETTDATNYRVGEVIRPVDSAAWDFDGTDDQVRIGNSSSYNNTLDKTVAMWINAGSGVGGEFTIICTNRLAGDQEVNLSFSLDDRKVVRTWNPSGTDEMVLYYSVGNGTSSFFTWSKEKLGLTTGDNLWHYVVGVTDVSQNKIFLYYDGSNVHSTTISGTIDTPSADLRLGSGYGPTDSTYGFTGKISAFRVYNKRLTDQQIIENFNQQSSRFNPPNWSNRDIVKDGLMLWLDAGITESYPGTGTSWYDISGQGNDGTLMNSAEATWSGSGESGSFDFEADGSSSNYCQIGSSGSVASNLQVQSHTLEAWINTESFEGTSGLGMIVGSQCDSCTATGLSMFTDSRAAHGGGPNCFHYQFGNGSSWTADSSYGNTASGTCALGVWIHIVVCWTADGTSRPKNVYKNGAFLSSEGSYSSSSWVIDYGGTSWRIGSQQDIPGRAFDGKIAVARIYNRELSASEIEQNFQVQRQRFGV